MHFGLTWIRYRPSVLHDFLYLDIKTLFIGDRRPNKIVFYDSLSSPFIWYQENFVLLLFKNLIDETLTTCEFVPINKIHQIDGPPRKAWIEVTSFLKDTLSVEDERVQKKTLD